MTSGSAISAGSRRPWSLPSHGFSARLPRGAKSGATPFSAITAVSAAGMSAMLVTTAPFVDTTGFSGVKIASTPNASMNQRSLSSARSPEPAIAPAWPTARVSFDFQRPTTQATTGLSTSMPCS